MENHRKRYLKLDDKDTFFNSQSVASATDCTGLIPNSPGSVDEVDSYGEIYDVPRPDNKVNNGLQQE